MNNYRHPQYGSKATNLEDGEWHITLTLTRRIDEACTEVSGWTEATPGWSMSTTVAITHKRLYTDALGRDAILTVPTELTWCPGAGWDGEDRWLACGMHYRSIDQFLSKWIARRA